MARKSANIPTSLWRDELFLSHTAGQKFLYVFLLSQRNLDAGGLLPLTARRWAGMIGSTDPDTVRADLRALAASHFAEIDEGRDEVFVSGYFASESIGKQPRRAAAAFAAINESFSKRLRAVALAELADEVRLGYEHTPRGIRAVVLERDGYRCRACGWKPGDAAAAAASASEIFRGLEVDHVYPRSLGGTNDLGNLQTLCSLCNTLKGAKV